MLAVTLIHVGPGGLNCVVECSALKVEDSLNHEETALVGHLGVEEELEVGTHLTVGHAKDLVLKGLLFN